MNIENADKFIQDKWKNMEVIPSKRNFGSFQNTTQDNFMMNKNTVTSPSLEALRKKFLESDNSESGSDNFSNAGSDSELSADQDIDVRLMRPKRNDNTDSEQSGKERTVIISKDKGVKGAQG